MERLTILRDLAPHVAQFHASQAGLATLPVAWFVSVVALVLWLIRYLGHPVF